MGRSVGKCRIPMNKHRELPTMSLRQNTCSLRGAFNHGTPHPIQPDYLMAFVIITTLNVLAR